MNAWNNMDSDDDVIDLGPIKIVRNGSDLEIINRWGEETIAYVEPMIDSRDWAEMRRRTGYQS